MEYFVMVVLVATGAEKYLVVSVEDGGTLTVVESYDDHIQAKAMAEYLGGGDVPEWMIA
jgi:hypothetical protein